MDPPYYGMSCNQVAGDTARQDLFSASMLTMTDSGASTRPSTGPRALDSRRSSFNPSPYHPQNDSATFLRRRLAEEQMLPPQSIDADDGADNIIDILTTRVIADTRIFTSNNTSSPPTRRHVLERLSILPPRVDRPHRGQTASDPHGHQGRRERILSILDRALAVMDAPDDVFDPAALLSWSSSSITTGVEELEERRQPESRRFPFPFDQQ